MLTRMVWLSVFGRPDSFAIGIKVYANKFNPIYHNSGTSTTPATKTKSMGLPADALLAAFFAEPLIQYTLTRNLYAIYRDWQKTRQPLTDGT